jgi:hypothetical protein
VVRILGTRGAVGTASCCESPERTLQPFSSYLNVRGNSLDGVKKGLARRHGDRGGFRSCATSNDAHDSILKRYCNLIAAARSLAVISDLELVERKARSLCESGLLL